MTGSADHTPGHKPMQTAPATSADMSDNETPAVTVYYDGACPLCRREIGVYQRAETGDRVAFVDVSGDGSPPDGLSRDAALARFHVKTADGTLHSGATAFTKLWGEVPGWRWLGRLVALPGIRHLAEASYRGFLVIRPWVQRRVVALETARSR
ncbi:MAG: DUF393 domain-containing protein [Pseudomonadota bacterium]